MHVNQETVDLVRRVISKHGSIILSAQGKSMYPFIRQRDLCHFSASDPSTFIKGEVVLFATCSHQLVAHRFIKRVYKDNQLFYLFKGDTNLLFDELIHPEQIIGQMTMIERQNVKINVRSKKNKLWSFLITSLPVMSKLLRKFTFRKGDFQY